MIESDGLVNALGAIVEALEIIEEDELVENPDFYETPEGLAIQHYKDIIDLAVQACDLNPHLSNRQGRNAARNNFIKQALPNTDKSELYEKLRRMSPKEYADLYGTHILSDKKFDDLVRDWPKC
jgi:hypothetical protein